MCPDGDLFSTYEHGNGGTILIENNVICDVVNKGTVQIKMHDGIVRTLTNVRHIFSLKRISSLSLFLYMSYMETKASKT